MSWTIHIVAPNNVTDQVLCETADRALDTAIELRDRGYSIARIDENSIVWLQGPALEVALNDHRRG